MYLSKEKFYYFSVGILYLFLFQSFAGAQTQTPTPENNSTGEEQIQTEKKPEETLQAETVQKTAESLVHFGDLIDVDVIGSVEYDWRGNLNPEGFLNGINFVGEPIYGLCRSEVEIASDIAKGFSKLLRDPQIVVKVLDRSGRPVSLLYGAVKTPHRFSIQRRVRLNELLILSGGITEKASGEIQILRPANLSCEARIIQTNVSVESGTEQTEKFIPAIQNVEAQFFNIKISDLIKGKLESNPVIYSGDTITVLEAEPIYVIGGVTSPKRMIATAELTVSRAIAAGGGFTKDADPKRITIFRRGKSETRLIEIDFEKIKTSPEADIVLQALDIVDVARTGREKSKFPPVINVVEQSTGQNLNPPLRIID